MPRDYIPAKDADLDAFGVNFHTLIAATPATYGLVAADATALAPFVTAYTAALATATDPSTRTQPTVAAKDTARVALVDQLRFLANKVQSASGVSDEAKADLGLTIRDTGPTPIPAPTTYPILAVVGATPLAHGLRYSDSATPAARKKPFGAVSMELRRSVGTVAATDPSAMDFLANVSRNPVSSDFVGADAGKVASYAGRWINAKGQAGPWSAIVSFTVAA